MSRIPPAVVCLIAAAAYAQGADVRSAGARAVPGSYIVVLNDDAARVAGEADLSLPTVGEVAQDMAFLYGARTTIVYEAALRGFAARMSAAQARDLAGDARVAYVEQD